MSDSAVLDSPAVLPSTPAVPAPPEKVSPAKALEIYQGDANFMTSLARGLTVLETFTQQMPQMTISQLANKTGLSRAAVRRCLYTLNKLGYVGSEDGQRYSLRPKMLSLSHTYTVSNTLSSAAQPILERMSEKLNESFSVATLDGDEIVYIARTQVQRLMSVDLHIGSRLPAYCTSMGRVLIASQPPDEVERYLSRVVLKPFTPRTVNTVEKLRMLLRNVRRNGYAVCDQEYEVGLRSMAVPVYAPSGKVIATINLSGHAPRMPMMEMQAKFLPYLRAAANELSVFLR
ncbi:IclR family transcriptional regulator domain-containing protein [Terriglobus sp. ADX1]|uniref:IclR family transcriptional regulator domain-containing protein n=1 Tax=Terriglobus sp. ADX1 TaxID=2794063 RepID=UPI002FE53C09